MKHCFRFIFGGTCLIELLTGMINTSQAIMDLSVTIECEMIWVLGRLALNKHSYAFFKKKKHLKHDIISLGSIYMNLIGKAERCQWSYCHKPGLCQPWGPSMCCSEQIVSGQQPAGISHKLMAHLIMYSHHINAMCLFSKQYKMACWPYNDQKCSTISVRKQFWP